MPIHIPQQSLLKIHFNIFFHLYLGLTSGLFLWCLTKNILFYFLTCPIYVSCSVNLIIIDLMNLVIFGEECKLWVSSLSNFLLRSVTSLDPDILLSTLPLSRWTITHTHAKPRVQCLARRMDVLRWHYAPHFSHGLYLLRSAHALTVSPTWAPLYGYSQKINLNKSTSHFSPQIKFSSSPINVQSVSIVTGDWFSPLCHPSTSARTTWVRSPCSFILTLSYVCDAGVLTSKGFLVKVKTSILSSLQEKRA